MKVAMKRNGFKVRLVLHGLHYWPSNNYSIFPSLDSTSLKCDPYLPLRVVMRTQFKEQSADKAKKKILY